MKSKHDTNGVRTAQDLERKYDFASILGLKKNVETSEKGLTKIENELLNFMNSTVGNIEDLQSQIDGKVTTWYYNGQPTLENYPVNTWEDDKENHIGDLYYDKETGYCYIFQKETDFSWKKIEDKDVIESLAIANSAKDTADNKRQIFINEPKTPYDTGDFWINNNEIYICQVSRAAGDFNSKDWINNLKYTDDTVAEAVDGKLTVLSGTVTEITQNYVKYTDLATGGSTTIAGENIKTGSITSNNYVKDKTGMKINLSDGIIDTKNFKTDTEGNVYLGESGKIMGGNGILTNLVYSGFVRGQLYVGNGDYIPLGRVGGGDSSVSAQTNELVFSFDLPNKFTPISAKIKLFHAPLLWDNIESYTVTGYSRNLKLYKGTNISNLKIKLSPGGYIYSSGITLSEISNALGSNGFTGSGSQVTSVESIDLTNQINSDGANYFVIKDSENKLYTDNLNIFGRTGGVFGYIEILGYMTTE